MRKQGYTLIELLVVLAIVAMLLTLASPRYFGHIDKAKEDVLHEDLYIMRDAIDKFYSDHGRYPEKLEDLVTFKYLREIPRDPFTDSRSSWTVEAPEEQGTGLVFNVRASAGIKARDGSKVSDW